MDKLWIQACEIRAATGGNVRQIYKTLQENPPKQQATTAPAKKADFMETVLDYKEKHGTDYKTAYLKCRKADPAAFDAWLESVQ